jgi:uncharacterized damage-inducible protein DinB
MPVSADTLRLHLAYSAWASQRLLDAASQLTPDELECNFDTADKSVLGTLAHIFAGDRVWLARFEGTTRATLLDPEDRHLETLQKEWRALHDRWMRWAESLTDDGALAPLSYVDFRGNPWEQPAWQIVLHVVNHGTHHRGQVIGFLRSMGHTPPPVDLHVYHRSIDNQG